MIRFGTDGVRGVAGESPIDADGAERVGSAVARWSWQVGDGRVLIGRDTRPSGAELAAAVASGASRAGARVLDAGVVPTPALGCALAHGTGVAAVMITASHNPWPDNGFKVLGPGGRKPQDAEVVQLEGWMAADPFERVGGTLEPTSMVLTAWHTALCGDAPTWSLLKGVPIALDLANGAASIAADWIREQVPARWTLIGGGGLPNDGCGSESLGALGDAVRSSGAALGIALDGDGDRCRIVDEHGRPVPGDAVTWLLARDRGVRRLAVTVMSNGALEGHLSGVEVLRTPVGDKHLQRAMAGGIPLGAEESGHVLFSDHPAGDGLLAGLRVATAVVARGPASQVFDAFVPLPRATAKVRIERRPELSSVASLQEAIGDVERSMRPAGRVFLRYSGTEPVLRILVEGEPLGGLDEAVERLVAAAKRALA